MLVIVFVGSGYIKAFKDTEAEAAKLGQAGTFASKIYGFKHVDSIFGLLLAFSAIMLLLLVISLIVLVLRAGKVTWPTTPPDATP